MFRPFCYVSTLVGIARRLVALSGIQDDRIL